MAAQSGKDMLLKLDQTGSGSFLTVAGLRTRSLGVQRGGDRHHRRRERRALARAAGGGGIKRAAVAGRASSRTRRRTRRSASCSLPGRSANWQLILPDFGTVEGPFQITALEFSADHAGEVTFEIALESAGELTFAA